MQPTDQWSSPQGTRGIFGQCPFADRLGTFTWVFFRGECAFLFLLAALSDKFLMLQICGGKGKKMKKVGIVMGSDSDLPIIKKATDMLASLGIPYEAHIYSAHRTPDEARDFARGARDNGFGVIIAAAGMAAHLAGAIAANTTLPVIGIPCKGPNFDGMDALLSTVQMPSGIPVATVAVNGGANAALLAAEILALGDEALARALDEKRAADAAAVLAKDAALSAGI